MVCSVYVYTFGACLSRLTGLGVDCLTGLGLACTACLTALGGDWTACSVNLRTILIEDFIWMWE